MDKGLLIMFCYCLASVWSKTLSKDSHSYIGEVGLNKNKSLNSECGSSFECDGKLLCYSGVCGCSYDMFWNGTNCLMRKGHMTLCKMSNECQDTLQCKDTTCECEETDYWNGTKCNLRKTFKDVCKNTEECRNLLFCAREICQCASSDYWTGSTCAIRKSVNASCSFSNECGDSLQCADGKCRCCESDYWNGSICRKRKLMNTLCTSDDECLDELHCFKNICQCPDERYWNQNQCVMKKVFSDACTSSEECQQTLHCLDGKCTCRTNEFWTHSTCSQRKGLDSPCTSTHECQSNLECTNYRCSCRSLYYWDGINCSRKWPKECADIMSDKDGVYTIYPIKKMSVYCIMRGTKKWTVIQRRIYGSVDFYRSWSDYKAGFGSVMGDYWLGNDNIHVISTRGKHELSLYLEDFRGNFKYANYSTFTIGDEETQYVLTLSGYSGNAGNNLRYHNGMKFTTYDEDNDLDDNGNCAEYCHEGWWLNDCHCMSLNGHQNSTTRTGIRWNGLQYDHDRFMWKTLLMIRKR